MTRSQTLAVEAAGLAKAFGEVRAVDGVDLAVPAGSVYGFLGPNGAGKTTTLRILATLIAPDAGTARILGHDVTRSAATVRSLISLTGQFASVDEELTATENLVLLGRLLGLGRARARARAGVLLQAFGLDRAAGTLAGKLSGGMRRRLDIAAGLIVRSEVVFLDEPTTGLDPRSRNEVWAVVRALAADGVTVLLTTQYLEEADQLADRIAIIDHGRVIAEGTSSQLKSKVGRGSLHVLLQEPGQTPAAEQILGDVLGTPVQRRSEPGALTALASDPDLAARVLIELSAAGITVAELTLGQPSLDEVFLTLTGHPADTEAAVA